MSEAPKPRRTRAKATTSTAAADSNSAPTAETQAHGDASPAAAVASRPASDAPPEADTATETSQQAQPAGTQETGNVPKPASNSDTASPAARVRYQDIRESLQKHAEWPRILATVREMRSDSKLADMKTEARERFIWGELDRLYQSKAEAPKEGGENGVSPLAATETPVSKAQSTALIPSTGEGRVQGLGDIPPSWPPLPANAALSVELGWVQANRLYVVEELAAGGTRVHLDRAHEPAPSRAAIGWLETSIRSYAKYVEVCAKVTGSGDEEHEDMKRERLAIEEIHELLLEMAGNPTGPGR